MRAAVMVALSKLKSKLATGRVFTLRFNSLGQRCCSEILRYSHESCQQLLPRASCLVDPSNQLHVEFKYMRWNVTVHGFGGLPRRLFKVTALTHPVEYEGRHRVGQAFYPPNVKTFENIER